MNRIVPWIMPMAAALISAAIAHRHYGESFWLIFAIVFFGAAFVLLINGLIIMVEDEIPGGFNNPDGVVPTPWVQRVRKIFWTIIGFLVLLTALAIWASKKGYW